MPRQSQYFLTAIKNAILIMVAALYCLAPLHQPLTDGFHKLQHTILNTNGNHSHDLAHESDLNHDHEHQMLSFFTNLFEDPTSGEERTTKVVTLDKHFIQALVAVKSGISLSFKNNFIYNTSAYWALLPSHSEPPEQHLS